MRRDQLSLDETYYADQFGVSGPCRLISLSLWKEPQGQGFRPHLGVAVQRTFGGNRVGYLAVHTRRRVWSSKGSADQIVKDLQGLQLPEWPDSRDEEFRSDEEFYSRSRAVLAQFEDSLPSGLHVGMVNTIQISCTWSQMQEMLEKARQESVERVAAEETKEKKANDDWTKVNEEMSRTGLISLGFGNSRVRRDSDEIRIPLEVFLQTLSRVPTHNPYAPQHWYAERGNGAPDSKDR